MGKLEKRFFSSAGKTLINPDDNNAEAICQVLKKALGKSDWVARGGMSSKYYFNFDKIYNQFNSDRK
ncbi:MAG: hypothetical protein C4B58_01550 [Deltaproteobacteria bacterium]|nr:MAG: hypothetical protein C4B58_01550 [Deltaproteobacteria bacterium]